VSGDYLYLPEGGRGWCSGGDRPSVPPVSLSRLRFTPGSHEVVYARKGGHGEPEQTESERIDALEFVARVTGADPGPQTPFGPLLRLLLERRPG